jgi:hypothetical protein
MGPGQVLKDPHVPVGGVRAVLSNFDVDVDAPKPEHVAFLNTSVLPILMSPRSRLWLQGQASHTGTHAHNVELSHRRAQKIAAHLTARGIPPSRIQIDRVGDSLAGPKRLENSGARAVSLLAAARSAAARPQAARSCTRDHHEHTGLTVGLGVSTSVGKMVPGFTGP